MLIIEHFTGKAQGAMQLIVEKITLPACVNHVSRGRLVGLLQESLSTCTSTVIIGRAGCGKTILSVDFARRCGRATAWYKVDAPDGELQIFFKYLIAGIQQQRPAFGLENLRPLLRKESSTDIDVLAEAFVYELLESEYEPLLVVIEDLHLIYDAPWVVPFFRRLLPLLPADVHLIITSRTMPPAPLWRMRSKQSLSVIEEPALAFTRQEASELFESHGLSCEEAIIALDHTHGRAAALNLCAEALLAPGNNGVTANAAESTWAR
jgi:LuxR family transcriptional regulator, maltose regulon positive regulatory protein